MKKSHFILLLFFLSFFSCTPNESLPPPQPYFSAIIVNDMDRSIAWYTRNLGFTILNSTSNLDIGLKQANLQLENALLELIELQSAVSIGELVSEDQPNLRTVGLFKIGFQVTEFDQWVDRLAAQNVNFRGEVVTDSLSGKRMVILLDPDGNRVQLFEQ